MFVLLLLFQHVFGKDTSKDTYLIEKIDSCPDIGYFFKRESNPNALEQSCYLCFCQNNGTAVCWPRDSRRCDKKHYYHLGKRKRESRLRRSLSFSDIFFRDAARDVFNKQLPSEQCKPYESSYSEGCPPVQEENSSLFIHALALFALVDWCIGCTVCDCDANGRWDCHVLSFCPDNKGKKQIKKRKSVLRNKITKRQLSTKKPTRTTTKKPTKKPPMKNISKNQNKKQVRKQWKQNKKQINTKNKKTKDTQKKKMAMNKSKAAPQKKNTPARKYKNLNKKNAQQDKKANKAKNTNTKTSKPKNINKTDATAMFAENILKKVMASVEKILNQSQKNINKSNAKVIQKRSMSKKVNTNTKKSMNIQKSKAKPKMVNKVNKKQWMKKVLANKQNEKLGINFRRKREVIMTENFENMIKKDNVTITESKLQDGKQIRNEFVLENTTFDTLNKLNYFSYTLDSRNASSEINLTTNVSLKSTINNNNKINRNTDTNNSDPFVYKEIRTTSTTENTQNNKTTDNFKAMLDISFKNMTQNFNRIDVYKNETCGKVCEFRKTLKKFFFNFRKKNATTLPNIRKKFNILGKMKTFLNKIFQTTQTKGKKSTNNERYPLRKRNFIKTICKNFSSCNYNFTDKVLRSKLNQLKVESNRIIKSVNIIKGLLKLLNSNRSNGKNKEISENQFKNNDERILIAILKDEHEAFLLNLTETQRIQIRYIKENTLIFIQSVENFANVLNDLVDYISNRKNIKKIKLSRRYHRCVRNKQNIINNNETVFQKLDRLKKLLVHYNLVQNKFMKQMYDAISTLESTRNTTDIKKIPKVSYKNENENDTVAIDNYMKNIIKNLRKLKDLAQKLSSKSRRKRSAMGDDDAIEYLLTLMEYILMQNRPLDVSPVNDGIDLIIEAIKSAPDIKTIKKKVLDLAETTEGLKNSISQENDYISNITQTSARKFKTFESIDDEDTELMVHSISNDEKNLPNILKKNKILTTQPHKIIYNDINLKVSTDEEKMKNKNKGKPKFEIFFDDDEDDTTVDNASKTKDSEVETSITTEAINTMPTRTQRPSDKKSKELKTDTKTRLDWIDEAYSNEKRRIVETTTEKIIKATRTIKQKDKYANGVSSVSEENVEKNEKFKANSDEVYKRQMNLFNTLDYGTEKSILDSDSREEKYNVETFPLYFA